MQSGAERQWSLATKLCLALCLPLAALILIAILTGVSIRAGIAESTEALEGTGERFIDSGIDPGSGDQIDPARSRKPA